MGKQTLFAALVLVAGTHSVHAATYTVDSTGDAAGDCSGAVPNTCTLRAAIAAANVDSVRDTITVSVSGTITLLSNLPAITNPVVIDGNGVTVEGDGNSVLRYSGSTAGSYTVSELTLTGGSAAADGGCFNFAVSGAADVALTDVTITACTTTSGGDGGGAALELVSGSTLALTRVTLSDNTAAGDGGGLWTRLVGSGTMTVLDSTISGNAAVKGGGIEVARGRLSVKRSTIAGNTSTGNGAGIHLDVDGASGGSVELENVTIALNSSSATGGGISAASGNTQPSRVIHTTIAQNSATIAGGGIGTAASAMAIFPGTSTNPFTSNIVAENTVGAGSNNCATAFTHNSSDSGYNRSNDTSCGFTQGSDSQTFDAAWLDNALADHLGQTETLRLFAGTIAAPNTAIDAANPTYATSIDQRNAPASDGNADASSARDIGAYEFAGFGAMQFTASTFTVREDGTPAAIGVQRFGNTGPATDIDFSTSNGTATGVGSCPGTANANADYQTVSNAAVLFAGGQSSPSAAVNVVICGDPGAETDETVLLSLAGPAQGSDVGARNGATLTIQEIAEGTLQFSSPTFAASENAGTVNMVIEVTRTGGSSDAVAVSYTIAGTSTATGGGVDYTDATATPGTLSWANGDAASKFIVLSLNNDTACELAETVNFQLSGATNGATLGAQTTTTFTINDNDGTGAGTVQFDAASYTVAEDAGSKVVTVKRVGGCVGAISVQVDDAPGTATEPADYVFLGPSTLSWASGETADKTVAVNIVDDSARESNHSFQLDLVNPVGTMTGGTDPVTVTITPEADEAIQVQFTATSYSVLENGVNVTLNVENVEMVDGDNISVSFASGNGTATPGSDYTAVSSTLSWTGGTAAGTDKTITVPITSDAFVEGNEDFQVTLSAPTGGSSLTGTNPVTVTIIDPAAISFATASFASAAETGGSTLTVTVRRTGSNAGAVSVTYNIDDTCSGVPNCATLGGDYNASLSGTLTWANGDSTNKTFPITVLGDALLEGNENIALSLTNPTGGAILGSPSTATAVITDDEYRLQFAAASPHAVAESGTAAIAVQRSGSTIGAASVSFATANGTAIAGSDYTATASPPTLSWAAGEGGTKTINVPITTDSLDEIDETFTVTLSSPSNNGNGEAQSVGAPLTVAITDNDDPPQLVIGDLGAITEGHIAASTATFTVRLTDGAGNDTPSGKTVMVTATTGGGTATADGDYDSASELLTISAGSTTATFDVSVNGDTTDEPNETFDVTLSLASNADILDGTGVGTIVDDDDAPTVALSLADSPLAENGGVATVTATLSAPSGKTVTVDLGFTGTAADTFDYTRSATSISIPAGSITGSITLTGVDDALDEPAESVVVDISGTTNATEIGTEQVTAIVADDDGEPSVTLSLNGSPLAENGGVATVTATLSAVSGQDVTVDLAFTGTATNADDYVRSGVQISIPAGSTSGSVTLTGVEDALDEADETVVVDVAGVTNAAESGTQQVTATITDNDATPTVALSLSGSPMAEAAGAATLTATLSALSGQTVTVTLGFTGTATLTTDYTRSATSIVIAPGSLTGTATLTAVTDTLDEANETIVVDITGVSNGTESGTQQVIATITDDDAAPTVTLTPATATIAEANGATTLTATLSAVSGQAVTVTLLLSGTATTVSDYTVSTTTITIPAGSLTGTTTITSVNDGSDEANETVVVDISAVTNGTESGTQRSTVTITDDDETPSGGGGGSFSLLSLAVLLSVWLRRRRIALAQ